MGWWGLATLSFDRYEMAQSLQGRSCILCFETILDDDISKSGLQFFCKIGVAFFLISCRLTANSFLVWHTFIFSDLEKLKNLIFSSFFNVEAIYLEGWLSKSYEILLLCKKKLKIFMAQKSS